MPTNLSKFAFCKSFGVCVRDLHIIFGFRTSDFTQRTNTITKKLNQANLFTVEGEEKCGFVSECREGVLPPPR